MYGRRRRRISLIYLVTKDFLSLSFLLSFLSWPRLSSLVSLLFLLLAGAGQGRSFHYFLLRPSVRPSFHVDIKVEVMFLSSYDFPICQFHIGSQTLVRARIEPLVLSPVNNPFLPPSPSLFPDNTTLNPNPPPCRKLRPQSTYRDRETCCMQRSSRAVRCVGH